MSLPPVETIRHLLERLRANDITWFRDKYKAGELAWLKDHMPDGGYEAFGKELEAGKLDRLRGVLPGIPGVRDLPGVGPLLAGLGGLGAAGAAAGVKATSAVRGATGAATGAGELYERKKRGGLFWLVPVAIIAALVAAIGLTKCGKDDDDKGTVVETTLSGETTVAAETDTTAPAETAAPVETAAPATEAPAATEAPTTAAAAADTTAAAHAGDDIVTTALGNGSFTKLGAAIGAAGLGDTLKGAGPFTVFAPTDAAFDALPAGVLDALLKPENKDTLTKVLTYHVVPGMAMAADLKSGPLTTAEGSDLTVTVDGGSVKVNDATVTSADVAASNGVIHAIDKVLLPAGLDLSALGAAPSTEAAPTTVAAPDTTAAAAPTTVAEVQSVGAPEELTIYFDSGKATIRATEQAKIDGAVEQLKTLAAGTKVNLIGHADARGDKAANQALSVRRANAVEKALKAGLGAKAADLTFTVGAVGDAQADADLAKSRKVTIEIAP